MLPSPRSPQAFAEPAVFQQVTGAPRLSQARVELLREITVLDEYGARRTLHIPAERPLTVFVDKRELVTLMTLGACPELLVLGWLLNQRLVADVGEVESVTVDWEVGAAAVKTRNGIAHLADKTARRVVTTGCGQGTVFGERVGHVFQKYQPEHDVLIFRRVHVRPQFVGRGPECFLDLVVHRVLRVNNSVDFTTN